MDIDIQKMFKQKNREILINNLKLDVDRNMEVLINTLTNIFNNQFDIALKNIGSMYGEKINDKELVKILIPLKNKSFTLLCDQLEIKKERLLQEIEILEFVENKIQEYYKLVFCTTSDVITVFMSDSMADLKKDVISKFNDISSKVLKEEDLSIMNYRIRDYISERLFGKLEEKVKEEFLIRDNNLSNKGKESYIKFQELEEKTVNI